MAEPVPFTAFNFDVTLEVDAAGDIGLTNPLCAASFAECDGLEMTMEPKVVREGGGNTRQVQLVGPVSYSNLTLKRGMTANLDLWKWFTGTASTARGARATGVVLMKNADGTPTLRFTLHRCLPVKIKAPGLNAKDGLLALEEMQIAYEDFTVEPADGAGGGFGFGAGVSAGAGLSAGISIGAGVSANVNLTGSINF